MEIGQRLKQARLELGLSQRQLCGDVITRNMLSLIENGAARPSMDTLSYLAGRLGKPLGYFLEEDAVTSPNQQVMQSARQAFAAGEHAWTLTLLKEYKAPDAVFDWEQALLDAECRMALAEQAIREGRMPYAASLLEQARQAGTRTPYFGQAHRNRWQLQMAALKPETASELCVDASLLCKAELALASDPCRAAALLDAMDVRETPRWCLLRGQAALALKAYGDAARWLHSAEGAFPGETAPLLEKCYRELGDYKQAYEYACRQR